MIIRLSIADNDFSHRIAQFCNGLKYKMFSIETHKELNDIDANSYPDIKTKSKEEIEAIIDDINRQKKVRDAIKTLRAKLMKPGLYFEPDSIEFKKIENEILRLWLLYADDDIKKFIPNISLVKYIDERDENGEAVYYMTAFDAVIIM